MPEVHAAVTIPDECVGPEGSDDDDDDDDDYDDDYVLWLSPLNYDH